MVVINFAQNLPLDFLALRLGYAVFKFYFTFLRRGPKIFGLRIPVAFSPGLNPKNPKLKLYPGFMYHLLENFYFFFALVKFLSVKNL